MQLWIISYFRQILKNKKTNDQVKHIYVCLADHYEPYLNNVTQRKAHQRVKRWVKNYPVIAFKHTDSFGNHPQHTYFYPEEEYDEWVLEQIKILCDKGIGDLEIHLHHDDDTSENLTITLNKFKQLLYDKHGFLRKDSNNVITYGFIHGNWALDNSRPDGKWCGVDDEIDVLLKTGCKFDMTMPSAPSDTQTSTINSIYLAKEDGLRKSHDTGKTFNKGIPIKEDELLMIQGPLTLDWNNRKFGIIPRIDAGELSFDAPPTAERVELWEKCGISLPDVENHIFIKLHTHGLDDSNSEMFFDKQGFENLWNALESRFKDSDSYKLHYVTAWQMYNKIIELSNN